MSDLKHTVILASAGSGKTFRLAHHFIHLLVHNIPVDRILALTFSRKASGEITDSIVKYLYEAATNADKAKNISQRLHHPDLTTADFARLLSQLLAHIHRLGTSTLDSFLINILQSFPFELGVPPAVRFMENGSFEAVHLRHATLSRILAPYGLSGKDRQRFMAAFHHSTGGRSEATVISLLETFIDAGLATFKSMPDVQSWGDPTRIWAVGDLHRILATPPSEEDAQQWANDVATILNQKQGFNKTLAKSLINLANDCALYSSASSTVPNNLEGKATSTVAEHLFAESAATDIEIPYNRGTHSLGRTVTECLHKLLSRVLHIEIQKGIARTKGLHQVLSAYADAYDRSIKQTGLMTFSDAQNILAEHSDADSRLAIDYRLDGRIDHWLLDEFQDTSDPQWKGLSHLIDEVIQDSSSARTFFMVGDVKQAIHGWRGGNPHLAQFILDQYRSSITSEAMGESFRSCADIIQAVNTCFGQLKNGDLPREAVSRWNHQWQDHSTRINKPGHVCLLEVDESAPREEDEEDAGETRHKVVADILRKLDPCRYQLSVAILTRSNLESNRIANYLRGNLPDIPVSLEGVSPFIDNLVAQTLLALIDVSLHPADTQLWQFIHMTPLSAHLHENGLTKETLPAFVVRELHDQGCPAFFQHWGEIMAGCGMLDEFGRRVVSRMILVAHDFIATGSSIEQLVPFMRKAHWTPASTPGGVCILTIHRSKGLGFDAVILPQLDTHGHYLDRADLGGILVHRDARGVDQPWRLDIPPRNWAELDPTLRRHIQTQDALSCYDELCVLYVAMTRAKRGLYMLVPPKREKEGKGLKVSEFLRMSLNAGNGVPSLMSAQASCLFESGSASWSTDESNQSRTRPPLTPTASPSELTPKESDRPRLKMLEPSKTADHATSLSWLFDEKHNDVLAFGTAIHELLAQVEWIGNTDAQSVIDSWLPRASCNERVRADVLDRFKQCLTQDAIRKALTVPDGEAVLWREKPFELILENKLVRGIFDRVVIKTKDGTTTSATILDFKSDRITAVEVHARTALHQGQMELYRKALSKILRVPENVIHCKLLFVVPGVVSAV